MNFVDVVRELKTRNLSALQYSAPLRFDDWLRQGLIVIRASENEDYDSVLAQLVTDQDFVSADPSHLKNAALAEALTSLGILRPNFASSVFVQPPKTIWVYSRQAVTETEAYLMYSHFWPNCDLRNHQIVSLCNPALPFLL